MSPRPDAALALGAQLVRYREASKASEIAWKLYQESQAEERDADRDDLDVLATVKIRRMRLHGEWAGSERARMVAAELVTLALCEAIDFDVHAAGEDAPEKALEASLRLCKLVLAPAEVRHVAE